MEPEKPFTAGEAFNAALNALRDSLAIVAQVEEYLRHQQHVPTTGPAQTDPVCDRINEIIYNSHPFEMFIRTLHGLASSRTAGILYPLGQLRDFQNLDPIRRRERVRGLMRQHFFSYGNKEMLELIEQTILNGQMKLRAQRFVAWTARAQADLIEAAKEKQHARAASRGGDYGHRFREAVRWARRDEICAASKQLQTDKVGLKRVLAGRAALLDLRDCAQIPEGVVNLGFCIAPVVVTTFCDPGQPHEHFAVSSSDRHDFDFEGFAKAIAEVEEGQPWIDYPSGTGRGIRSPPGRNPAFMYVAPLLELVKQFLK